MFRIAFWALNLWSVKKGFDLLKENTELKQKTKDNEATIRTLAREVSKAPEAPLESQTLMEEGIEF